MRADLIHGHLDLLVLSVLAGGAAHGYAMAEELRRRSGGELDLREGTLYPALYRLEAAGLLSSAWLQAGGRRRRMYRLTRPGRRALERQRNEWSAFARTVTQVIGEKAWIGPA
jgi:transcriptional regulator